MIPFDLKQEISSDAFVGIKKENKEYIFYLPKGFNEYKNKFSAIELKKLFFDFYKLFKKHQNTKPKDGVDNSKGIGGESKKDTPIFYGSLNIDEIISNFDETSILGFTSKYIKDDEIDYSKIGEYLDEVNYTKDNIPILTEPILQPKNIITTSPQEIVSMYCFIYFDIKTQLNEEIPEYIKSLAFQFRDKYLSPNASFFDEVDISNECKDILEKIDRNSLQTDEYLEFFDSVYKFLYFDIENDGVVAGIDNFYSIWEDMCFYYMFKYFKDDILYADYKKEANLKLNGYTRMYAQNNKSENYPFKITFGDDVKYIYPDLVFFASKNYILNNYICEYKYINNRYLDKPPMIYYKMFIHKSIWNKLQETIKEKGFFENEKNTEKCNENTDFLNIVYNQDNIDFFKENKLQEATKKLSKILYECKYIIHLIDFKYKTSDEIDEKDKVKQKFYELALKNGKILENKFVLPKYSEEKKLRVSEDQVDNLKIQYWNFRLLLEEYLK